MTIKLRPATPDDAGTLAELINIAGDGLPLALWTRQTDSTRDAMTVGREQVADEGSVFSWTKASVAVEDGHLAGMVLSHMTAETPGWFTEETPAVYRPLAILEHEAPATRLIDAVCVLERFRNRGVASALIKDAEMSPGANGMSFITHNRNQDARAFYARLGYREDTTAPLIRADWQTPATEWILMRKP
jgi:GNAT superfamily N-acetyltransferase